jgi:hypothetical protein
MRQRATHMLTAAAAIVTAVGPAAAWAGSTGALADGSTWQRSVSSVSQLADGSTWQRPASGVTVLADGSTWQGVGDTPQPTDGSTWQ